MTHAELETAYLALCNTVQQQGMEIIGYAGAGRAQEAGEAAAMLVEMVATRREQYKMQQEQAGNYDLAALKVESNKASDSETGWEKRDA